jgi:hypothetical protein
MATIVLRSMQVMCVQKTSEVGTSIPDLIVFPEYSELRDLTTAVQRCPNSIVVGAVVDDDATTRERVPWTRMPVP